MKVLALLSQKGGAGKTTLAVHLAVHAHLSGERVALIDIDPQRSAGDWWRAREDKMPALAKCCRQLSSDARRWPRATSLCCCSATMSGRERRSISGSQ